MNFNLLCFLQSDNEDVFTSELGSHVTLRKCQSVRPNVMRSGYCVKQGNVVRLVSCHISWVESVFADNMP